MTKSTNFFKPFIGCFLILLQLSDSWCQDIAPSVVKIYSNFEYLCAGTLVRGNFVVTSAECLKWQKEASALRVVGNLLFSQLTAAEAAEVSEIFKPQDYDEKTRYMNVAVLKLNKSIAGPKVKPAQLCKQKTIEAGATVTVHAFDLKDSDKIPVTADLLLKSHNLKVTSKHFCKAKYTEKFSDKIFCAYNLEKIECFADKGGPAIINGEFCGIYNYGVTCLDKIAPGSFTSLADSNVLKFINDSLSK